MCRCMASRSTHAQMLMALITNKAGTEDWRTCWLVFGFSIPCLPALGRSTANALGDLEQADVQVDGLQVQDVLRRCLSVLLDCYLHGRQLQRPYASMHQPLVRLAKNALRRHTAARAAGHHLWHELHPGQRCMQPAAAANVLQRSTICL